MRSSLGAAGAWRHLLSFSSFGGDSLGWVSFAFAAVVVVVAAAVVAFAAALGGRARVPFCGDP